MKTFVLLLFLSTTGVASVTFTPFDTSITTPNGWIYDRSDTFGFVMRDQAAKHNQKIRVHFAESDATSVRDAAKLALKSINEIRAKRGQPLEVILSSGPVRTRSGINGWRSAHGFKGNSDPYIVHYFFQRSDGRILCVCAYLGYDPKVEKDYNDIILQTFDFPSRFPQGDIETERERQLRQAHINEIYQFKLTH
jgi:hypothetical protein